MINEEDFTKVTKEVIKRLEGGYYHPQMLTDGRVKDSRYASSGETMFGIDRKAGGTINDSTAGKQFWATIDQAGAKDKWKWNYMGGDLNEPLKEMASKVMYPVFVSNAKRYLTPKAQELVQKDQRLIFHFSYASWNGSGWFQRFAKPINEAVEKGVTDTNELTKIAIASRTQSGNSLIVQGGNKIAGFINDMLQLQIAGVKAGIEFVKKNP